ncbi:RTA1 like protein-domain-containing protein [Microdochium trichocladiopsis]|uniref:RTA1 like protein-domain-containing protein n=1 Tax=Microdochium trichocladiopsis TaxID=1682393 RepID=A0A9P9BN07_9PEZI|nr:RTA1 like protein-domain-containing protein [Microdochium trichocladiopsis]KAH7030766.1 RTA1 like protein-domain-containing protein [Microdochium trichocladiopsis]
MATPGDCEIRSCLQSDLSLRPSLSANAALCGLFSTLVVLALVRGLRSSSAIFTSLLLVGLSLEVLGYVGRILLSVNTYDHNNFALFFVGTIIGPNFICGALFLCLPNIIHVYGPNFRTWIPPWYHAIVLGLATISLVLELAGGVLATAVVDNSKVALGVQLVAVGLAVLIVSLAIFVAHATLLALALRTRRHGLGFEHAQLYNSKKFKTFLFGFSSATLLILLRSTFRLITVVMGFTSQDPQNEILLLVLDGLMVLVASLLLLLPFPPRILQKTWFAFRAPEPAATMSGGQDVHFQSHSYASQHTYSPYYGRLPGPPPRPPPPRPQPPPSLNVHPSPVYDHHKTQTPSPGVGINYSRGTSVVSGEPSPTPPTAYAFREEPRKNMVTSESLW